MSDARRGSLRPIRRVTVGVLAAGGGFAIAALPAITAARSFTLQVAKNAPVTDQSNKTTHESIVVDSKGAAVYTLSGDSKRHPKCTKANNCFSFWPPVTVASRKDLSKARGVPGKLALWKRNGFLQVVLNGKPLYTYVGDVVKRSARGQDAASFGGTWHVRKASTSGTTTGTTTMMTTTTTTTTTKTTSTVTTPCTYPPYC